MAQVADKVARKKSKASSTPSAKPKIKPSNKQKAKKCKQDSTRCTHYSVMYGDLARDTRRGDDVMPGVQGMVPRDLCRSSGNTRRSRI